ncbi:MAG: polysaccharide deacetylase family protein [Bacteroidota bacterium]
MKGAYLTIDDSPSKDMQAKVDFLFQQQIPAVFFCRGDFMEADPEPVIQAIRKGFVIANHSYNHPHFSDLDMDEAHLEIQQTHELIDRLYQEADVNRPANWFRFPFGDKGDGRYGLVLNPLTDPRGQNRKAIIQAMLRHLGYDQPRFPQLSYQYYQQTGLATDADWHWTYDTMEWSLTLARPLKGLERLEGLLKRMDDPAPKDVRGQQSQGKNRWLSSSSTEVILLHDHEETTSIFEALIEGFVQRGIQFLPFSPLFQQG